MLEKGKPLYLFYFEVCKWLYRGTLFILAFFIVTSIGCTKNINTVMSSWIGHHKSELFLSWGPPGKVFPDGKGGEILVYEFHRDLGQTPGEATIDYYGNIHYTNPKDRGYVATRMFYVDKDGYIYAWKWKGL